MEGGGTEPGQGASSALKEERRDIDLSLDDIIQLQKKEHNDSLTTLERIGQQKNLIKRYTFGHQERRYSHPQRVESLRSRANQKGYYGTQWKIAKPGGTGLSPLNRQAFNQKVHKNEIQLVKRVNSWQTKIHRRQMQQKRTFRSEGFPTGQPKRVVPQITRPAPQTTQKQQRPAMEMQQRKNKFNLNRGFLQRTLNNRVNLPNTQRWQPIAVSGSVLTVSVPNPRAGQIGKGNSTGVKQIQTSGSITPFVRRRKTSKQIKSQSKGVSLSFNFKALANQTHFTLNERFSTLKARRQFTAAAARRGRTVTLI